VFWLAVAGLDDSPGNERRPCAGAELGRTKDALTLPW